jgi:predicted O-methyltransferase YrrM
VDVRYWARAAASLAKNLRTPGFAASLLRAGLVLDARPRAPTVPFLAAYPAAEGLPVDLGSVTYRLNNLDPLEQFVLAALTRLRRPQTIFEFGTFDGATTLLLAYNSPEAAVYTLDLPPDQAARATVAAEAANVVGGVGSRFAGAPEAARIHQLYGDSRAFDFSPWAASVDLILVDGGHERDVVASDTRHAFELLRPGGLIVWDDYVAGWPGVVSAVDALEARVIQIANTDLAVYDDAAGTPSAAS